MSPEADIAVRLVAALELNDGDSSDAAALLRALDEHDFDLWAAAVAWIDGD